MLFNYVMLSTSDSNGIIYNKCTFFNMKPGHRPNVIPWLFDALSLYLSTPSTEARSSPLKRRSLVHQKQQVQRSECLDG